MHLEQTEQKQMEFALVFKKQFLGVWKIFWERESESEQRCISISRRLPFPAAICWECFSCSHVNTHFHISPTIKISRALGALLFQICSNMLRYAQIWPSSRLWKDLNFSVRQSKVRILNFGALADERLMSSARTWHNLLISNRRLKLRFAQQDFPMC